jgi:hypothetical protein
VAAARAAWRAEGEAGVGGMAPERLVFPGGCGVPTNVARLRGRSPRGTRAVGAAPFGHRTRPTVPGALGIGGMPAAMSVGAATGGAVFLAHPDRVPPPEPRRTKPDAVPLPDDLRAHETAAVRGLLDRSGFACRHLPAHSPDPNPTEPAWAKPKAEPRRLAARATAAPHHALGPALDTITAQDAAGSFRHAGCGRPK